MDKPQELDLKFMIFGGILIVLLLAVSIIIFFIAYQKRLLAQQNELQRVQSEYQLQLLTSSINAQEKERVRIGHDLHDEIGSSLSTIKLLVNQIQWHDEESNRVVINIKDILSNTIQDVRNISNNLYPSVLVKFGLTNALQNLALLFSEASALEVSYNIEEVVGLTYVQELALYRITQELLNNVTKHADAKHLYITLSQSDQRILLQVKDDGLGFDYSFVKHNSKSGIGLGSIEARTAMLQAELQVYSGNDLGTKVEIYLPLIYK